MQKIKQAIAERCKEKKKEVIAKKIKQKTILNIYQPNINNGIFILFLPVVSMAMVMNIHPIDESKPLVTHSLTFSIVFNLNI